MELHALGLNYSHDGSFDIRRPNGSGDNLLLIFKSSAVVRLHGREYSVSPDSAILYKKGTEQIYRACKGFYINNWLHFDCDDMLTRDYSLPYDTIFMLSDAEKTEDILSTISRLSLSESGRREDYIELMLRMLLIRLGEEYSLSKSGQPPRKRSHYADALERLRADIYSSPSGSRNIADMAKTLSVSPSHFQYLYTSRFGVSCYEDILCARMKNAEYYLLSTDMTVKNIAAVCGYENDVHFMRQFKRRYNMTPSQFRQKNKK